LKLRIDIVLKKNYIKIAEFACKMKKIRYILSEGSLFFTHNTRFNFFRQAAQSLFFGQLLFDISQEIRVKICFSA
jgi:hypothetical protein